MKKNVRNVAFVAIIAGSLVFLYTQRLSLDNLKNISLSELAVLIICSFVALMMLALGLKHGLKIFHLDVGFKEWFGLNVCNLMFNYYLPAKGGTIVRAYYLKNRFGFKYSHYISLAAFSYLISLVLFSGVGFLAVIFRYITENAYSQILGMLFFLFFVGSLLIILVIFLMFRRNRGIGIKKIDSLVFQIKDGLSYFTQSKTQVFYYILFSFLYLIVMAIRLFLCFSFLGAKIDLLEALMIMSLSQFSFLISVIPGNLGLKEGIIVFSSNLLDISPEQAILAAIVDRVVAMLVIFSLGFIFSKILLKKFDLEQSQKVMIHSDE